MLWWRLLLARIYGRVLYQYFALRSRRVQIEEIPLSNAIFYLRSNGCYYVKQNDQEHFGFVILRHGLYPLTLEKYDAKERVAPGKLFKLKSPRHNQHR